MNIPVCIHAYVAPIPIAHGIVPQNDVYIPTAYVRPLLIILILAALSASFQFYFARCVAVMTIPTKGNDSSTLTCTSFLLPILNLYFL